MFSATAVWASPLTRAVQTALVGLAPLLGAAARGGYEEEERAEEDQGELLCAKAVFFRNFSWVGSIMGAL